MPKCVRCRLLRAPSGSRARKKTSANAGLLPWLVAFRSDAISAMDYAGVETARLEEFEIPSQAGSECRLSAADDHRVDKQVTFVDEIGFERKPRKLGAANADVVLRFPLEFRE